MTDPGCTTVIGGLITHLKHFSAFTLGFFLSLLSGPSKWLDRRFNTNWLGGGVSVASLFCQNIEKFHEQSI